MSSSSEDWEGRRFREETAPGSALHPEDFPASNPEKMDLRKREEIQRPEYPDSWDPADAQMALIALSIAGIIRMNALSSRLLHRNSKDNKAIRQETRIRMIRQAHILGKDQPDPEDGCLSERRNCAAILCMR